MQCDSLDIDKDLVLNILMISIQVARVKCTIDVVALEMIMTH